MGPSSRQNPDTIENHTIASRAITRIGQVVTWVLRWITQVIAASGKFKPTFYRPDARANAGRLVQAVPVQGATGGLDRVKEDIGDLLLAARKRSERSQDTEVIDSLRNAVMTLKRLWLGLSNRELEKEAAVSLVRSARDDMGKSRPVNEWQRVSALVMVVLVTSVLAPLFVVAGSFTLALSILPFAGWAIWEVVFRDIRRYRGPAYSQIALKRAFERLRIDVEGLFNDSDDRSGTTVTP